MISTCLEHVAFRALLTIFMITDPSPLTDEQDEALRAFLDLEARKRGFESWVDAFHDFKVE